MDQSIGLDIWISIVYNFCLHSYQWSFTSSNKPIQLEYDSTIHEEQKWLSDDCSQLKSKDIAFMLACSLFMYLHHANLWFVFQNKCISRPFFFLRIQARHSPWFEQFKLALKYTWRTYQTVTMCKIAMLFFVSECVLILLFQVICIFAFLKQTLFCSSHTCLSPLKP